LLEPGCLKTILCVFEASRLTSSSPRGPPPLPT
jgi:hypothetical protein